MESTFIHSVNIQEFKGSEDQYHADKNFISVSGMKKLKVSPAHFREEEEIKETEALIFGSAYHCFVLEPDRFENEYYIFNDHDICEKLTSEGFQKPRATKEYKIWEESQQRIIADKKVITQDMFEIITEMKTRLMRHPYAKMLLTGGRNEVGYMGEVVTDAGAINVKFKPDKIIEGKRLCIDLKTTIDASLDGFTRHAADLDYHLQAAFYSDMLTKMSGDNRDFSFFFIAQEKKRPYAFNIFEAGPQFIAQGRYEYEMLLQLYKYCSENDYWPGYQVWCENRYGILELKLPAYHIKPLDYFIHNYSQTNSVKNGKQLAVSN